MQIVKLFVAYVLLHLFAWMVDLILAATGDQREPFLRAASASKEHVGGFFEQVMLRGTDLQLIGA